MPPPPCGHKFQASFSDELPLDHHMFKRFYLVVHRLWEFVGARTQIGQTFKFDANTHVGAVQGVRKTGSSLFNLFVWYTKV